MKTYVNVVDDGFADIEVYYQHKSFGTYVDVRFVLYQSGLLVIWDDPQDSDKRIVFPPGFYSTFHFSKPDSCPSAPETEPTPLP